MTTRLILAALPAWLLAAGIAAAQPGGSEPPAAVPPGARAEIVPLAFPLSPLTFAIEPEGAAAAPARPAVAAQPRTAAAMNVAVRPGGSEPPAGVPSGAKAPIAPLAFPVAPLAFTTEATVADVSVRQEGREQRFTLAADVLFDFDRAELRPEADVALRKFLGQLGPRASRASLRIEGHTDGKGSDAYNDRLAAQRAQSVQGWLARSGAVPPAAMTTSGFGKRRPVAANTRPDGSDDPDGRQRNRRVEIVVGGL